jgi:hypothetical protein
VKGKGKQKAVSEALEDEDEEDEEDLTTSVAWKSAVEAELSHNRARLVLLKEHIRSLEARLR